MLTPLALGGLSALLVLAGVVMLWRERRSARNQWLPAPRSSAKRVPTNAETGRRVARAAPPAAGDTDPTDMSPAEVTIVHRQQRPGIRAPESALAPGPTAARASPASAFEQLQSAVSAISDEATSDAQGADVESQRWPSVESRWLTLEPQIEATITRLNDTLAPVALQIGPAGETGWSFKNGGFGTYRRIAIAGRSVAWLRGEANHRGEVVFKVRAHAPEQALLNASTLLPLANLTALGFLEALSKTVKPSAEYAAWLTPSRTTEPERTPDAWGEIAALTREAFAVARGALLEAGSDLTEVSDPAWDAASGHQRWPLVVQVSGNVVAAVHLSLIKRTLDISTTVADPTRTDLNRRRRLDLSGLTPHVLAEAIASCAWPAVADTLEKTDAVPLGYAG
jgi:hypothetical protein